MTTRTTTITTGKPGTRVLVATAPKMRAYLEYTLLEAATPAPHETVDHETAETVLEFTFGWCLEEPRGRRGWELTSWGRDFPLDPEADGTVTFSPGWSFERAAEVDRIGNRWHLNGLKAGCAHVTPVDEPDGYGGTRPSCKDTPPCPVTGYRYGSAWLCEKLPEDVIEWVKGLAS